MEEEKLPEPEKEKKNEEGEPLKFPEKPKEVEQKPNPLLEIIRDDVSITQDEVDVKITIPF